VTKPKSKIKDELILKIKVEPRSSRAGVIGQYGDSLKVKLTSPPVEGRANKELIEILAKQFGVHKRNIEIISGHSSKNKLVKLHGRQEVGKKLSKE